MASEGLGSSWKKNLNGSKTRGFRDILTFKNQSFLPFSCTVNVRQWVGAAAREIKEHGQRHLFKCTNKQKDNWTKVQMYN